MTDSILTTIKKKVGLDEEYEAFDLDIITGINTAFMVLNQMGIGPEQTFKIEDKYTTWQEFSTSENIEPVKDYIALRVRLLFDPPTSSVLLESMERQIRELGWRLQVSEDNSKWED